MSYRPLIFFLFTFLILLSPVSRVHAQETTTATLSDNRNTNETLVKRFSNSESPDISFIVNTNLKDCVLDIRTNYPDEFKIRFIDYWGKSVKVYRNLYSGKQIDVSEFRNQIVIMNIQDNKTNRLLSSQVVNLKRRNYWVEEE